MPRSRRITEIRGPYYTAFGPSHLQDLLETVGPCIDILKFAGGSFAVMPARAVRQLIDLCHKSDVLVSTGGFIEYVLTQGGDAVRRYLGECRELGFDIVEVSSGFITVPADDLVRLVKQCSKAACGPSRKSAYSLVLAARRPRPSWKLRASATPAGRSAWPAATSMPARNSS
jgi:phosphosulfolactate synthase (CoM biosynthesis protein A)